MKPERISCFALTIVIGISLACVPSAPAQADDLSVLSGWIQWSDSANSLQHRLNSEAFQLLEKRSAVVSGLKSAEAWKGRQAEVRNLLEKAFGPFPARTPLNAKVLGTSKREGYTIERVIFESMPRFYVTACLFIPEPRIGKLPAILNVIGHTDIAFRAPSYQQLILNLVRKGFIVLAMDPIGQGERLQYYDPELKRSLIGSSTAEHSYLGKQCFLTGSSAARYFAWDGIRAIDYLVSRPEVDPLRIGVTGISGGGTQTSYISALDERVAAAAPACYIAGFGRLLQSIGPQDAEQNLNSGLLYGIDHADYLEVRAPRPTLVVATTRDFFSIQGTRETFAEAKQAFAQLGAADNLDMVEDDHGHGYTRKTREAIYQFFQRHLRNPGNPADEELDVLPVGELTVTRTGQSADSMDGETVFSLNRRDSERCAERLVSARGTLSGHLDRVVAEARRIAGYRPPDAGGGAVFRGRLARPGYQVEMYVLSSGDDIPLPVLLFLPVPGSYHRALIWLHPQGKSASAAPGGEIELLLKQGYAVLAPDLAGVGELGRADEAVAFLGVLVGRSVVGVRAAEISRCVQFLKGRPDVAGGEIGAVAWGSMGIALLHAAAFDPSIQKIALIEPLISFQSVVANRYYSLDAGALVANALTSYDLPDLAAALAPRPLALIDVADQLGKPIGPDSMEAGYRVTRDAYAMRGARDRLVIRTSIPGRPRAQVLGPLLK